MDFWTEMGGPGPESVVVGGVELRKGNRVRLRPRAGGEILDLSLAGRTAVVEGLDQDHEGGIHLSVTLEDDPGRDLGEERYIGHRFFFSVDEVEPLEAADAAGPPAGRVLVAGIGNIFLGDDGFGVEVARRLATRRLPTGVKVVEFGIRGLDLAYALQDYEAAILVDAVARGEAPGTLYVVEPDPGADADVALDTHGMDPVKVLRMARALGGIPARILLVGCEPGTITGGGPEDDVLIELSAPVRDAVDGAVSLVASLVQELAAPGRRRQAHPGGGSNGEGKAVNP